MCRSSSVYVPDTSAQTAETARQKEAEEARYQERLKVEQERWERQRVDEERRYNERLAAERVLREEQARVAEGERVRQEQRAAQIEAQRTRERQEDLARYEAEQREQQRLAQLQRDRETARDAAAAEAARRAATEQERRDAAELAYRNEQRTQAERDRADAQRRRDAAAAEAVRQQQERTAAIDGARNTVENQFSSYDDNYYRTYAETQLAAMLPQIQRDHEEAQRQGTFALARSGLTGSSAAATKFGRLARERASQEARAANSAQSAAGAFRQQVEGARQQALSVALQAINVGQNTGAGPAAAGAGADGGGATGATASAQEDFLAGVQRNTQSAIAGMGAAIGGPKTLGPLNNTFTAIINKGFQPVASPADTTMIDPTAILAKKQAAQAAGYVLS